MSIDKIAIALVLLGIVSLIIALSCNLRAKKLRRQLKDPKSKSECEYPKDNICPQLDAKALGWIMGRHMLSNQYPRVNPLLSSGYLCGTWQRLYMQKEKYTLAWPRSDISILDNQSDGYSHLLSTALMSNDILNHQYYIDTLKYSHINILDIHSGIFEILSGKAT